MSSQAADAAAPRSPRRISTYLKGLGIAVGALIAGAVGGFISQAYVEISFENVEGLKFTDFATWLKLVDALSFKFDITKPQLYKSYYGENIGNGETGISTAEFALRKFHLAGKIMGTKEKRELNGKPIVVKTPDEKPIYKIAGYENDDLMVLTQRGPKQGIGAFVIKHVQTGNNEMIYFGYFLTWDQKEPDRSDKWVTQCPLIMMNHDIANRYPTAEAARDAFGFLQTKCVEYKLPDSYAQQMK